MFFRKTPKDTVTAAASAAAKAVVPLPPETAKAPPTIGANTDISPPPAKAAALVQAATELAPDERKRRAAIAKHLASTFGEIVTLLMRSPQYKHHSLADLEWLVVPALLAGQFSLTTAPSNKTGSTTAVGVVLWACVSEETDRQLSGAPRHPIRLNQQDWNSGDVIWVIASVGDGRVLQEMLKRLQEKEWANKSAKVLAVAENGMPTVATIGAKAA